jgi:hypothetical protein
MWPSVIVKSGNDGRRQKRMESKHGTRPASWTHFYRGGELTVTNDDGEDDSEDKTSDDLVADGSPFPHPLLSSSLPCPGVERPRTTPDISLISDHHHTQ